MAEHFFVACARAVLYLMQRARGAGAREEAEAGCEVLPLSPWRTLVSDGALGPLAARPRSAAGKKPARGGEERSAGLLVLSLCPKPFNTRLRPLQAVFGFGVWPQNRGPGSHRSCRGVARQRSGPVPRRLSSRPAAGVAPARGQSQR